ncbi:type II toxin-antitoxin system HicB family antitoxin [Siccibacter turicensis]|uniref:type II toxin-antitoxin system HicB family antitoxin n=1 Tax=Siccibacter turicensis TaxID=357233 RepID=UPI0010203723|nr:type II toxin-antitoxin system HicB family antitoxin [Siccibacter turicensis]
MFFSVGVETPQDGNTAWGLIVPALCNDEYGCFSAADDKRSIAPAVREAILITLEAMLQNGRYDIANLVDEGYLSYAEQEAYRDYDSWFVIDVDLSAFEGRQQRINVALPDTLIKRIDNRVKESPDRYRDRSHFLALAARHELVNS